VLERPTRPAAQRRAKEGDPRSRRAAWQRAYRRRQAARRAVVSVEIDGGLVELLIALRWIDETQADDRKAIGDAIDRLLSDTAREMGFAAPKSRLLRRPGRPRLLIPAKRYSLASFKAEDLETILLMQNYRCAVCRTSLRRKKKHVDHIIPIARGGSNDRSNLQYLCVRCNIEKGAKDPIVFMRELGRLL
jgi:5-methylcytosine-specific restriction endonuclease McrA